MRIGDLNKRITFQSETKTADGMGGFTVVQKDEATVWAAIWPVSANEQVQAMQTAMVISHRIRVRYRDTIKGDWRIKYGSRYFAIINFVNPNEGNKLLDIMCKEIAS